MVEENGVRRLKLSDRETATSFNFRETKNALVSTLSSVAISASTDQNADLNNIK